MSRRLLFRASLVLIVSLALALLLVWTNLVSSSEFNGRYQSSGQIILSDGSQREVTQSLMIKEGRFHAMTQVAGTLLRTSGEVEFGFLDHMRLHVEKGEVLHLNAATGLDSQLLFNMLYSSEPDAIITLRPVEGSYLAVDPHQLYCPSADNDVF